MTGFPQATDAWPITDLGPRSTKAIIDGALRPKDRRILDIGCGTGALVAWLRRQGADAIGVDLNPTLLRAAAARLPADLPDKLNDRWIAARAEHLPLADGLCDAVIFFNSLHHIPRESVNAALAEAARVLRPGGDLLVIEPLASGTYFELLQPLDDERAVRAAALAAIDAVPGDLLEPLEGLRYGTSLDYASVDAVVAAFTRADPKRAAAVEQALPVIAERFASLGRKRAEGGRRFEQPMLALLLRRPRR